MNVLRQRETPVQSLGGWQYGEANQDSKKERGVRFSIPAAGDQYHRDFSPGLAIPASTDFTMASELPQLYTNSMGCHCFNDTNDITPAEVRYIPSPHVSASSSDGGLMILNKQDGLMFVSNSIGAGIWQGITSGATTGQLTRSLSQQYSISESIVRQHTSEFISELARRQLIIASK